MLRVLDRWAGNELDRLLAGAALRNARRVLIYWNRGLGDIALGLYGVIERIRHFMPCAEVTVVTWQAVASPNPRLRHLPLLTPDERIASIGVDRVAEAIEAAAGAPRWPMRLRRPGACGARAWPRPRSLRVEARADPPDGPDPRDGCARAGPAHRPQARMRAD